MRSIVASFLALTAAASAVPVTAAVRNSGDTTAWRGGSFHLDVPRVVGRSDIVLGQPNPAPAQSMPIGNGTLGAAVWAADGLTAQLNRNDTMPDRKSPGQVVIPGLAKLTAATDYRGRVDLYDGLYRQSGGGMTATTYVAAGRDELIVDVTGADPDTEQTATVRLWPPRKPTAEASGAIATLAETWTDDHGDGATGATFGTLAAVTAGGRDVTASVVDERTVQVSLHPHPDGSFRIVVASPHWPGGSAPGAVLGRDATEPPARLRGAQLAWWHRYWNSVGLLEASSPDQVADYAENLRTIYLYQAAASSHGTFPGSQAGVGDLFSFNRDYFRWDPAAYWHWNLRMMTGANLGAGAFDLNNPYFRLYRANLAAIQRWTRSHMGGRDGICVPETMRFNGAGYENETWLSGGGRPNCDASYSPYYNARTISTGAEVGLFVWQQYLWTRDEHFLAENYPLMAQAAKFLLAYATEGPDGKLHTYPSNAHETQWDVHDPTTDIAAEHALFPAVIAAAQHLHRDNGLIAALRAALPRLLPLPTAGTGSTQVIAASADPGAAQHNNENIGLEPVWPYQLIGDHGPDSDLAKRTFAARPSPVASDWSFDGVHAALLGLGDQLPGLLSTLVGKYQVYPTGMGVVAPDFAGEQPYSELLGGVALALNQALVTDQDGEVRVATGWPSTWDGAGTQFVHGRTRVHVQVRRGVPTTVAVSAGSHGSLRFRNPWPGQPVRVVDGAAAHHVVVAPTSETDLDIPIATGRSYVIERVATPTARLRFAPVTGTPATQDRKLGERTIGLPARVVPPAGTTQISDLPFLSATNGWGPVERDASNGEKAGGDGTTLNLHDVAYARGLGVHAASDVTVWLGGSCHTFTAQVGIDHEVYAGATLPTQATVAFQVYADDTLVYDSGPVNKNTPTLTARADTTGAARLRLHVGDAGDGNGSDHADWADATVTCS